MPASSVVWQGSKVHMASRGQGWRRGQGASLTLSSLWTKQAEECADFKQRGVLLRLCFRKPPLALIGWREDRVACSSRQGCPLEVISDGSVRGRAAPGQRAGNGLELADCMGCAGHKCPRSLSWLMMMLFPNRNYRGKTPGLGGCHRFSDDVWSRGQAT